MFSNCKPVGVLPKVNKSKTATRRCEPEKSKWQSRKVHTWPRFTFLFWKFEVSWSDHVFEIKKEIFLTPHLSEWLKILSHVLVRLCASLVVEVACFMFISCDGLFNLLFFFPGLVVLSNCITLGLCYYQATFDHRFLSSQWTEIFHFGGDGNHKFRFPWIAAIIPNSLRGVVATKETKFWTGHETIDWQSYFWKMWTETICFDSITRHQVLAVSLCLRQPGHIWPLEFWRAAKVWPWHRRCKFLRCLWIATLLWQLGRWANYMSQNHGRTFFGLVCCTQSLTVGL